MKNMIFGFTLVVSALSAFSASAATVREQWHNDMYNLTVMSDGSADFQAVCSMVTVPSGEWNEHGRKMMGNQGGGPVIRETTPVSVRAQLEVTGDFTQLRVWIGGEEQTVFTYGSNGRPGLVCL